MGGLKLGGGGRLYFLLAGVDAVALVTVGLGLAGGTAGLEATGAGAPSRPEAATPAFGTGTDDVVTALADAAVCTG